MVFPENELTVDVILPPEIVTLFALILKAEIAVSPLTTSAVPLPVISDISIMTSIANMKATLALVISTSEPNL